MQRALYCSTSQWKNAEYATVQFCIEVEWSLLTFHPHAVPYLCLSPGQQFNLWPPVVSQCIAGEGEKAVSRKRRQSEILRLRLLLPPVLPCTGSYSCGQKFQSRPKN